MTDANQTPAEPGTPPAIIGALFDFAEAECGHNPVAARHALTTVEAWVANAKAEIAKLRAENPHDIRACGWTVAVHNDYRLDGVAHTFWLFTQAGRAVKGEGRTDAEALNRVREQIGLRAAELLAGKGEG